MKVSKSLVAAVGFALLPPFALTNDLLAAELLAQTQIATAPPTFLRMEITSTCVDGGALFKLINRGAKWPRTANLKLYYADDRSFIGQRRLRLAGNQRVSFVVKDKVLSGRRVAVWVQPEWYSRDSEFDASLSCP